MAALPWILTAEQYIELSQYLQQFLVVSSLTRYIYIEHIINFLARKKMKYFTETKLA